MKQLVKAEAFDFRTNTSFKEVIGRCQQVRRTKQDGTWITDKVTEVYTSLHTLGFAHCAEAWQGGKLVGGLYGVRLGKVFFGESMFSEVSNASKYAFIKYVAQLKAEGVVLIDCQVYTEHLESLGARMISRQEFIETLAVNTSGV
jgi:leucyl/phenylalanyl-tRNA--protein transferase